MAKNEKLANLLIKKNIKMMLQKRGINAGDEAIAEIDRAISEQAGRIIDQIEYQMRLEGRKTAKKNDVVRSIERSAKKAESFEI